MKSPAWTHIAAFAVCLALAVIFTMPGSISLRSGLLGYPGDNFQHAWFLWYFARAVSSGHNPFFTQLIFFPTGANLAWGTFDPLAGAMALPLSLLAGPVIAYNVSLILQLALTAYCARLLYLKVCQNQIAALLGGLIFGLSPFLMAHALGHLSLVTAFPVPLYVLALAVLLDGRKPPWKAGPLLGLALLLTAFAHYDYTVFCLLFTLVIMGWELLIRRKGVCIRVWASFGFAAAVFLAGFAPVFAILIGDRSDWPPHRSLGHIRQFSADALGFFIPGWNHVVLGRWSHSLSPRIFQAGFEGTIYTGIPLLFLAALGFWWGRKTQCRWAARALFAGALFFLLSLGPSVRIFGWDTGIPGPAALLYKIPGASFVSAPARFDVITMLCLAMLASMGFACLLNNENANRRRPLLAGVIALLLAADFITIPFPRSSILDPPHILGAPGKDVACRIPGYVTGGTLLTFPLIDWPYSPRGMWMQAMDNGRYNLVDGYVSYTPEKVWEVFYENPLLRSLRALQANPSNPVYLNLDRKILLSATKELDISAIAIYSSPQSSAASKYLKATFGIKGTTAGSCSVFDLRSLAETSPRRELSR